MNLRSNGISGSVLQYLTRQTSSDLKNLKKKLFLSKKKLKFFIYLLSIGFCGLLSALFSPFCIVGGILF